jgi:hypothetical protein
VQEQMQWQNYTCIKRWYRYSKGKESISFFVEGDEQRMMLMGLRRFTKYTNMPILLTKRNYYQEISVRKRILLLGIKTFLVKFVC